MRADIALIVTCHEPYRSLLPGALTSIDRQSVGPAERVVVFDGCRPSSFVGDEWRCVAGDWGHPSAARNAGLNATTAPWLIFLDADNVAPPGYLEAVQRAIAAAPSNLAIIYPDIQYTDEALTPRARWEMPAWDYWQMRRQNCVDTSSAWRREAMEVLGGWPRVDFHEDYVLALSITAAGWKADRLDGPAILMREHGHGRRAVLRHRGGGLLTHIWKARSLGIVSLFAGRPSTLDRWMKFLLAAELPPNTGLYIVDNSGRSEFTRRVYEIGMLIASERNLSHFDVAVVGESYELNAREPYLTKVRHAHIAQLYAAVLPRITEDLVLTLEDDVEPPPDAVRKLGEEVGYPARANVGVVAAAYPSPVAPAQVCAGLGPAGWGGAIGWRDLPPRPLDVACVGGGCAVWANWALRECPPHVQWRMKLGWDGVLCTELSRRGYHVWLHGGVRCHHHSQASGHGISDAVSPLGVTPRPAPPRFAGASQGG
jgi:glycosyltransferase involved in cell wall biosynthesis